MTDDTMLQGEGMRIRREVLGDAHVDAAVAGTTPFTAPFQDFITRYAWGEIWARPGLDRHTRSCITLAVLTALHCRDEVGMHVRAALRNGLTPSEIQEVLLHTAIYAGVPAANEAFAIARRILDASEPERDSGTTPTDDTGAAQTAQNTCPRCAGTGQIADNTCPVCNGTGLVTAIVGDA
jgi:4-carboxymuconolactone decarboxylase